MLFMLYISLIELGPGQSIKFIEENEDALARYPWLEGRHCQVTLLTSKDRVLCSRHDGRDSSGHDPVLLALRRAQVSRVPEGQADLQLGLEAHRRRSQRQLLQGKK